MPATGAVAGDAVGGVGEVAAIRLILVVKGSFSMDGTPKGSHIVTIV
jgi:hypothetical protein